MSQEHRINRIRETTLRLIYPNQHQLTFKDILEKNKTASTHQKNLQTLATKIYKAKNKISPEVVNLLFEFTNKNYNLRNSSSFERKRYFTVHLGSESLAPKICELVRDSIRVIKTLSIFNNKIKAWTSDKCPCRLCKNYIGKLGLFKAVPITFITIISSFSNVGHKKRFMKASCIVCSCHFIKCALFCYYCFVVYFHVLNYSN